MIHVAAAAIFDSDGRVLVSKRATHQHQGGLWEFPGGKCEPGESVEQALARELEEELGIVPLEYSPLIRVRHHYGERELLLDFFRVTRFQGKARGLEAQPLKWLLPDEMEPNSFPAADRPVITALRLPDRYLITGEDASRQESFLRRLHDALDQGVGIVQLRAHGLSDERYRALLSACLPLCHQRGVRLVINRPDQVVEWLARADGIHMTARQLMSLSQRPAGAGLIGASCHNPDELAHVAQLELDYALLSPVAPTGSHPTHAHLGWTLFREWVDRVNVPVYALGGMRAESLLQAIDAGAQGIAGISTFWRLNP